MTKATTMATMPDTDGQTPSLVPTQNTKTVTDTATKITTPILTLTAGIGSRGC